MKKKKNILLLIVAVLAAVVIIAVITISNRDNAEISSKYMEPVGQAKADSIQ